MLRLIRSAVGISLQLHFPLVTTICTIIRKRDHQTFLNFLPAVVNISSTYWRSLVSLVFLTLKMPERVIPVNVYQFLHELLHTRALRRKNCQKSFRLLKSSKNPQLHWQYVLPANLPMCLLKCSYVRWYFFYYTCLKLLCPTFFCNTPGSLTAAWPLYQGSPVQTLLMNSKSS